MTNSYLKHPSEEALERFTLNRSGDQELEVLETHILACDSCITRLENLQLQIADLQTALAQSEAERIRKDAAPERSSWKSWFTLPTLSWAGAACTALALGLTFIPHNVHRVSYGSSGGATIQAAEGDLSACSPSDNDSSLSTCRGTEVATLPQNRPLDLRLNASDIPAGPVDVQVVNGNGGEIWHGHAIVNNERAEVSVPEISRPGPYFLRFYSAGVGSERELLREFRFEIQ